MGLMAYPDLKSERDNSMPVKTGGQAQVLGVTRRGTRVIWRKLNCLNPNLQKMQGIVRRKDTRGRRRALRRYRFSVVATFGAWSVAQ